MRNYATVVVDSRLNFPPDDSYQNRLVPLIDKEPASGLIDVDMFRLTMARPIDAIIRAAARGVRVRMYLEPSEYTNPARPGNKVQIDRLVAAAKTYPNTIEIRMRSHAGLNHQKTVWLHAQHVVAFGTSNWSDASDDNQLEANIFTDTVHDAFSDYLFTELNEIFERKFYNEAPDGSVETVAYKTPGLPRPDTSPTTCNDRAATNFGAPAPVHVPRFAAHSAAVHRANRGAVGRDRSQRGCSWQLASGAGHDRCRRCRPGQPRLRAGEDYAGARRSGQRIRNDVLCRREHPVPPVGPDTRSGQQHEERLRPRAVQRLGHVDGRRDDADRVDELGRNRSAERRCRHEPVRLGLGRQRLEHVGAKHLLPHEWPPHAAGAAA